MNNLTNNVNINLTINLTINRELIEQNRIIIRYSFVNKVNNE